jgi:microcompartment protein CcmK/EutM
MNRKQERRMRLGTVIGRVTLSKTVEGLRGARWLVVSPFTREHFQAGLQSARREQGTEPGGL